ncbi:sulfotransferase [Teredinibacter turnerae T7901]|uniref:Sulfotransferase n=1 Tax=Teredinibacter turnerae (strain ATCC 39867 / T7901) TaxID=377629 RepID=C5BK92_TERTT|nr:sulfotransferase [Teredinibacter turnerae T7901]
MTHPSMMLHSVSARLKWRNERKKDQRLQDAGWYDLAARSQLAPVFIGGCGRSGTTLFKELLNRHSLCACGPETSLYGLPHNLQNISVPWDIDYDHLKAMQQKSRNLIEFADAFAMEFLRSEGKQIWVEKTPNNVRAIEKILTWYPKGKFIHLIRDGRDVVCSLRHHPKERVKDGKIVPIKTTNSISKCATRWLNDTMRGLAFKSHPRCLEVRYEALTETPEESLQRICRFIGIDFEPVMLSGSGEKSCRSGQNMNNHNASDNISAKSVARWKTDLTATEREDFINIAGELLITLGYAQDHSWAES